MDDKVQYGISTSQIDPRQSNDEIKTGNPLSLAGDAKAEVSHIEANPENVEALFRAAAKSGENPILNGIPEEDLMEQVSSFAEKYGLEDEVDILRKGALVARNPSAFESLSCLNEDELKGLRFERDHKWRSITWPLVLTIAVGCLGAVVQGADQVASSGANLSFPKEFGIPNTDKANPNYLQNNFLVGLVNSGPYLSATVLAAWLADPLNHYFGRRITLAISAVFCWLAPIGSAFTQTWPQLFVTRLLLGIGVGIKECTAPVLASENSPTPIRGALTVSWNMMVAIGMVYGSSANLIFKDVGRIAWRLQMGSAMLPALILLLMAFTVPESPRWLIKKRKVSKAWKALLRLRKHRISAARDLYYMYVMITTEEAVLTQTSYFKRFCELFTKNRLKQATVASCILMIARQMCGINIMSFFSSSIFAEVTSETNALWASWGFALINAVFALPAVPLVDRVGRRPLLLWTFPFMFLSLLAGGLSYLSSDPQTKLGLMALFIYVFCALYSPGEGPVPFIYAPEAFPLFHREVGMAVSVSVNNMFATVLSMTFFRMRAVMTTTGAFGFYAGLNLVAFFAIFLFVPETKGHTLEELDAVFAVPFGKMVAYHVKHEFPVTFRRIFLRDRSVELLPITEMA